MIFSLGLLFLWGFRCRLFCLHAVLPVTFAAPKVRDNGPYSQASGTPVAWFGRTRFGANARTLSVSHHRSFSEHIHC
jgi:hypothetical protein